MPLRFAVIAVCLFVSLSANAAYRNNVDLISLHYDHAPDKDDGHAAVAALMVAKKLGIQPYVVSGAYGQHNGNRYDKGAEAVMRAAWGNNWQNAHSNWRLSVNNTTARWMQTINAGGDIYVAEGGQSDFTADVIRNLISQFSFNPKQRINVIQHSVWNERQANQSDLNYVKARANYTKIADGNNENATADLNKRSDSFVAKARNGEYANSWTAAFNYLSPNQKLDFSDTVELLHILGIGKDQVATVDDFGDLFFNRSVAPPTSGQRQPWSDSYSVGGQCYCDTTFDHDLANIKINTVAGSKSVRQICSDIRDKFGSGSASNRTYFNTVQCGHDPINSAPDEKACPGIPRSNGNYTGPDCNAKGATWNLDQLYTPPVTTPPPTETPTETPTNEQPKHQPKHQPKPKHRKYRPRHLLAR